MLFYRNCTLILLFFVLAVSTPSCGFKPLYKNAHSDQKLFGNVKVLEIAGKQGFHLREDLVRRFGSPKNGAYILEISLDTYKTKEVITPTNEITSYRLIMTAQYTMRNSSGELVMSEKMSAARTGFSSASNSTGYATQVAEDAAKTRLTVNLGENIYTQLLIYSENWFE